MLETWIKVIILHLHKFNLQHLGKERGKKEHNGHANCKKYTNSLE